MSDDRKLTAAQGQTVIAWLTERGASKPCPACGANSWSLLDELVIAPTMGRSGRMLAQGVPMVITTCTNCGFIRQFSAITVGVLPPQVP